jgi:hypothetical protein
MPHGRALPLAPFHHSCKHRPDNQVRGWDGCWVAAVLQMPSCCHCCDAVAVPTLVSCLRRCRCCCCRCSLQPGPFTAIACTGSGVSLVTQSASNRTLPAVDMHEGREMTLVCCRPACHRLLQSVLTAHIGPPVCRAIIVASRHFFTVATSGLIARCVSAIDAGSWGYSSSAPDATLLPLLQCCCCTYPCRSPAALPSLLSSLFPAAWPSHCCCMHGQQVT